MEDKYNDYDAFEKHMETTYPKMFAESYGGFAIGKGWWRIIDILCQNIQSHIDWKQKHGECPQVIVRRSAILF